METTLFVTRHELETIKRYSESDSGGYQVAVSLHPSLTGAADGFTPALVLRVPLGELGPEHQLGAVWQTVCVMREPGLAAGEAC